jgi:hypothetical protein
MIQICQRMKKEIKGSKIKKKRLLNNHGFPDIRLLLNSKR